MAVGLEAPPTHTEAPPTTNVVDTSIISKNRLHHLESEGPSREISSTCMSKELPRVHGDTCSCQERVHSCVLVRGRRSGANGEQRLVVDDDDRRQRPLDNGQRSPGNELRPPGDKLRPPGNDQTVEEGDEEELVSREELESFELLDISEFENDSSDSLPEVALPTTVSASDTPSTASVREPAVASAGSGAAQFNQSKLIVLSSTRNSLE